MDILYERFIERKFLDFLEYAPEEPEEFVNILSDIEKYILPGTLHWRHPDFYAYYPCAGSYCNILADMLATAVGGVGFSWVYYVE